MRRFVITAHASIRIRPYPTAPIIRAARVDESFPALAVEGLPHKGSVQWALVTLPSSVTGYVHCSAGRWEDATDADRT